MLSEPLGTVTELWRFPVKSMRGERLTEALVTEQGIQGDRAYALLDVETGRVVSASNTHYAGILDCTAAFIAPFTRDSAPPVRITLPTGASATSDSPALSVLLSDYFHRATELIHAIPASYASRQAEFFTEVGLALAAPTQSFMDLCSLSLISTATLTTLGHDQRRFRMNVVVHTETEGEGFPENAWLHRELAVGGALQLAVTMLDPRCVMTTLPQQELPKDPSILKSIVALNSQPVGTGKARPCAGVYASILQPGTIRQGEPVVLVELS